MSEGEDKNDLFMNLLEKFDDLQEKYKFQDNEYKEYVELLGQLRNKINRTIEEDDIYRDMPELVHVEETHVREDGNFVYNTFERNGDNFLYNNINIRLDEENNDLFTTGMNLTNFLYDSIVENLFNTNENMNFF
jgi:hypothetical protein